VGTILYFNLRSDLEGTKKQAQEYRREIMNLEQKLEDKDKTIGNLQSKVDGLQKEVDAKGPCAEIRDITSRVDRGDIFWHDFYFTNNSSKALHEVKVSVTIIGDNGKAKSLYKYFALWSIGQEQKVSISIDETTRRYQKWSMTGLCNEGNINLAWVP